MAQSRKGRFRVRDLSVEERERIAAELKKSLGLKIEDSIAELYKEEEQTIGVALSYLDCGCLFLCGFSQIGEFIGNIKTLESTNSCPAYHPKNIEKLGQAAVYNAIFWKDSSEEFDRKYGNERRIDIAGKLFPPPLEE